MSKKKIDKTDGTVTPDILTRRNGEAFIRRVIDGPVLTSEAQAEIFAANLRELISDEDFPAMAATVMADQDDDDFWDNDDHMSSRYRPYNVKNGVLTIPVMGSLINRLSYQVGRYATGYEYIQRAVERGMADSNVESIMFHVDSPGGQAAGNFELTEYIRSQRGVKPMMSMVQDYALSGGFSLGTAADEVVVTSSGATGSVGVVVMHVDFSEMLADFGIKVTFIKAGKHKTDGNSFEALSDDAKKRIQAGVDKFYGIFVSTVAENRQMSEDAVRGTEALVYDAEESVEVGFADRIGDYRKEVAAFAARNGETIMATKTDDKTTTDTVDTSKIAADARAEERKRFATVQASEHYKGREALAGKMLADTEMSGAEIVSMLEVAPAAGKVETETNGVDGDGKEKAKGKRDHFAEAMGKEGSPNVGGVEDDGDDDEQVDASVSILDAYRANGGRTRKTSA